jgi:ABC-type uncharacterized transport system permease subunit
MSGEPGRRLAGWAGVEARLGTRRGGYTLYYATNFIFTGLAVAVAFHARLFNIGGEGQAALGGLGVALVLLGFGWPHWTIALLAAILGARTFRRGLGRDPRLSAGQARQPYRDHHDHVQLHRLRAAVYLLVNVFRVEGSMAPESARFVESVHLPSAADFAGSWASAVPPRSTSPSSWRFWLRLVWVLIWRTRLGYEIRAFGHSETAAVYAGINPTKIIMITMLISGGCRG